VAANQRNIIKRTDSGFAELRSGLHVETVMIAARPPAYFKNRFLPILSTFNLLGAGGQPQQRPARLVK